MIDFDSMIDNFLYRETRPKQIGRYYPSEVGSCLRKLWYSYKFPVQIEPERIKLFQTGILLHDFVVRVLASEKNPDIELLHSELPFKLPVDDFIVSGRVDDLLLIKSSGKNVLVEVKSHKFLDSIKKPSETHVMQLQFYMHATGVHNGVLLYIEKNTLKSKVFTIPYDEGAAQENIARFRVLNRALKQDELPDPEAKKRKEMSWMCAYCDWKDKCDAAENGDEASE